MGTCGWAPISAVVARPKSPIFTWSFESRKMLTGFRSLWIIPWSWIWSSPKKSTCNSPEFPIGTKWVLFRVVHPRYILRRVWQLQMNHIKGWMTRLIRISVSQNLPEPNKSSYWAVDVVKKTVKSWNSQMNFYSVEIFPRDVNCRKRHHSGSTLLHMRTCAMGSQSPTSTTLAHFWLLGSK